MRGQDIYICVFNENKVWYVIMSAKIMSYFNEQIQNENLWFTGNNKLITLTVLFTTIDTQWE